ncbi:hypothetical protein [Halocola ammonii]
MGPDHAGGIASLLGMIQRPAVRRKTLKTGSSIYQERRKKKQTGKEPATAGTCLT